MEIIILGFGQITDIIGKSELKLNGVSSTEELNKKLAEIFPLLASMEYAIAINHKLIHTNTKLNNKDVVALLPPFSGG